MIAVKRSEIESEVRNTWPKKYTMIPKEHDEDEERKLQESVDEHRQVRFACCVWPHEYSKRPKLYLSFDYGAKILDSDCQHDLAFLECCLCFYGITKMPLLNPQTSSLSPHCVQ